MNYLKVYCNLIRKAENRTPPEGYTEKHHTFPVSIFGKNSRMVVLTAREHYVAHFLLYKVCAKRYGKNHSYFKKMQLAFWLMCNYDRYGNTCSKLYQILREEISQRYSGDNNPAKLPENRIKISKGVAGLGDRHPMKNLENRRKQSEMMKKNNPTKRQDVIEKKRLKMLGNKNSLGHRHTEKQKNNLSNSLCKEMYEVLSPYGVVFIVKNLNSFCLKNNLDSSSMYKIVREKLKHYKGWTCRKLTKYEYA
jgi:hypothetical protein